MSCKLCSDNYLDGIAAGKEETAKQIFEELEDYLDFYSLEGLKRRIPELKKKYLQELEK